VAGEIDTQEVITDLLPSLHSDSRAHLNFWSEADLIQWIDEALKRLARTAMLFVERDTSTATAAGTATYPLPARHLASLHISYGSSPLRPAAMVELEARDEGFQNTIGAPDHWYEDKLGMATVGVAPVPPDSAVTLAIIMSCVPPEVDAAKVNTLVQAPAPLKGYLAFSVLGEAYGRESETEQPDLAKHCRARVQLYEQILQRYYGPGL